MLTKKKEKVNEENLRSLIFNWMFDSNRLDKLEKIAIAYEELGFSQGEIGKKLGVSQERIAKYYRQYKESLQAEKKKNELYMSEVNWHIRCAVKGGHLDEDEARRMTEKEKIDFFNKSL